MKKRMVQKKKCLSLKTFAVAVLMALFAMPANAQNVYMHTGSMTVPSSGTISFYDSGGESHGPDYYWERWFQRNEEFTFTFSPAETGKKVKVTFNEFTAYLDNGGYNHAIGSDWSLRLNTAELSVYDGEEVNADNLITTYTGNMTGAFSVIANGPITFYFHSYGYREEGWQATVQCVENYELQKPQISFEACSDAIVINANNKGAEIYYTTDGNDPDHRDILANTQLYQGPFNVDAPTTIKAIVKLNGDYSEVATKQFTANDVTPTPGVPTISREGNIITMTPAAISEEINETYYVWYTTDGTEPSTTNGQRYTAPFEWHTPNTTFKAVTRASSCSDKLSTMVEFPFEDVKVPTPTITFSNGSATIACTMPDVTIYYTIDGSIPTDNSLVYQGPFSVSYGTTVNAIAIMEDEEGNELDGFESSDMASEIYVPEGGSGADGSVVILDDREDHSWSYYSDKDQPIRSLNPADVKITYFGNGTGTINTTNGATPSSSSWTQNATTVQISHTETESQFVYLKTLERTDGLTSNNPTGRCEYTTIPNPFLKRPTYQYTSGTNNKYCGFYGWRIKAIRGGKIYNANNTQYSAYTSGNVNTTNWLYAETAYYFEPDSEYGMEVELEALWARAYVVTGTNSMSTTADSYERNFHVITSSTTASNLQKSYPLTISSRYPNGDNGGGSLNAGNFTASADTKFENISLGTSNNNTYYGNTHDLIFGRGVTGTVNTVMGLSTTTSYSAIDNTIRLESGTYNNLWLTNNSSSTFSNTVSIKGIIGCDYDRAKGDDSKVKIASSSSTFIEGCGKSCVFSSQNNRNNLTFDWYVKSGKIQDGISVNTADPFYLGVYQNSSDDNGTQYLGKRRLTIEGGEMGTVAGGCGAFETEGNTTYSTYAVNDGGWTVMIRMRKGIVNGSVYGAAVYTGANGDRRMVFTGGTVKGWIAGGCNGTRTDGGDLYGDSYIYFGGKAKCDGSQTTQVGTSTSGNIMGAGSGNNEATGETATVGRVTNSNIVIADEATVARNVYGGGNYGYVRVGEGNKSDIYVLGGTVSGSVFGGSNQQQGQIVNMWMKGGTVSGSLYGGSNTSGTVKGLATVNMSGGTVTNVYGGGFGASTNMAAGTVVNVSNGTINNNVYGGGELGTVTGNTNVTVTGGTMKNVFGAGKGGNTTAQISGQTFVTISGGTISESVYGGGENGDVASGSGGSNTRNVVVTLNGNHNQQQQNRRARLIITSADGSLNQTIYWPRYGYQSPSTTTVTVPCNSEITVTYYYDPSYYPTGLSYNIKSEDGTETYVNQPTQPTSNNFVSKFTIISNVAPELASTVTVSGGSITGDVFGGGRMGKTGGSTEVDIKGGTIRGSVFGGAYGSAGTVYVAGTHSVNIMGGRIFSSVYGGSRNANDALAFTGYNTTETAMSSVVNISAGQVDEQVYAAGYFGQTFGSVYVFVGKNAILNAPHCAPSFGDENENMYKTGKLLLAYNVWAGGDWGVFEGGSFGAPTVSGYSDIYVDGEGYDTQTSDESAPSYMNIKGSLLGCGTSCDAGTQGRGIYVRNYGHANGGSKEGFNEPFSNATRSFFSIQRADTLIIDNSHLNFTGQAKINSLDATEKYAIFSFDKTVRVTSGSSLFLNAPVFQIIDFWSATVDDLYNGINAVYTPIAYDGLGATGGPIDNKVRVNGGNYIEIYHDKMINGTTGGYGMLNGFAHMMVAESNADNTCAYARPKQCVPTEIDNGLDNPNDGGWVSYNPDENTFSIGTYSNGAWTSVPNTGGTDQIPYENHTTTTKAGEQYFRIWRVGGMYSEREGVINAYANGSESFNYVDVTIKLPAWRSSSAYYKFQTSGTGTNLNTTIDYGPDVMTYPTAITGVTDGTQNWIHFVESSNSQLTGADSDAQLLINSNPNVNFGLVTMAGDGMTLVSPVSSQGGLIVCPESDEYLASVDNNGTVNKFTCSNNTVEPQVTFRLTYSNQISTNMTWDPMFITLVQCDANGNITDIVKISLTINTYTTINNVFTTQTYAMMDGQHGTADTYTAKVILPTFDLYDYAAEHLSEFILTDVTFEPNTKDATPQSWEPKGSTYDFTHFAMEIAASRNADNSDGWNGTASGTYDSYSYQAPASVKLGETGARSPFAFDFTLTYNGNNNNVAFNEDSEHPALLGVLTFTIKFTNYKYGTGDDHSQLLTIKVQVIRRGVGKVFYLDGQNGSNGNSALYPNDAALSLSYIFNRCGYMPGDIIYIVNTVDVTKNLEWSGSAYSGVTIYRYPGGHPLTTKPVTDQQGNPLYYTDETQTETTITPTDWPLTYTPLIVDNEDNEAFTGTLVAVGNKGNLTIRDITLDGHMTERTSPYSTTQNPLTDAGVNATSPMITIASGGTVTMTNGTLLQHNNSTVDGGAVAVNDGGTLKMNHNASIMNNVTGGQGGAVYMAGTMIVSDAVQIIENTSGTTANNVYLSAADKVIQIGTTDASDEFGPFTFTQQTNSDGEPLYWTNENQTETTTQVTNYPVMIPDAQIGVTKTLYGNIDGYTEVVKVETTNEIPWLAGPFVRPNTIIFHDGHKYELEKYEDPTYLYWIGTWVTVQDHKPTVDEGGWNYDDDITEIENFDIYTEYQLAWIISLVNGENNQPANTFEGKTVTIHKDIDMNESIWVPIGTTTTHFKGTFEGNGHVISGIHSILVNDNTAMFGVTEGATIQNVEAVVYFDGNSINKGTFIGTMNGGTLANVEAAGALVGKANTINMGGLVGLAQTYTYEDEQNNNVVINNPVIHSGFSVNTIIAEKATTVVGGLVGSLGNEESDNDHHADLYNSYANVTLGSDNVATTVGGLVGINRAGCTVENCYVVNPINTSAVFAYTNKGTISICYAENGTTNFVVSTSENPSLNPTKHGTYAAVLGRKDLGYMYGDNKVTLIGSNNDYVTAEDKIYYDGVKIEKWRGLLSTLNQWVKDNPKDLDEPAPWFRPTTGDINGDLPLLGFHKDNSLSTAVYTKFENDYNYLHYGAFDATDNGLDNLLTLNAGKSAYMFLYGNATKVVGETGSNQLFINEDAVLIQDPIASSKDGEPQYKTINATVGVTFDNSNRNQSDYFGHPLEYDWHLMSTPLANAPMGISYNDDAQNWWEVDDSGQVTEVSHSYMPDDIDKQQTVKWDFYCYYEPEYHWINFKRNKYSHHHFDEPHEFIDYTNEEYMERGKGYMMAISQDSYLSNDGKLNAGDVTITLTCSGTLPEPGEPTKDWGSNLIGNPYQAYLDLVKVSKGVENQFQGTNYTKFFVYDAESGLYAPFVVDQSKNTVTPSRYIHPHQGFFVLMDDATTSEDFTFRYGMATTDTDPQGGSYFRGEEQVNYPLVNIFAENAQGNRDLTIIEFNRPELGGAEKIYRLRNADFMISAYLENQDYAMLFAPENTEKIPVHFKASEDGTYTLRWNTENGNFTSLRLVDNITGINYDMLANNSYTFEAHASDYSSRFYITYACTGIDEEEDVDIVNSNFAFFNGSEWVINGKGRLDVVDVLGRVVYSERLYNDQNRVGLNDVAKGVYLLRIADNKNVMVQKIVVK